MTLNKEQVTKWFNCDNHCYCNEGFLNLCKTLERILQEMNRLKQKYERLYTSYEALVEYGYIDKRRLDDCRRLLREVNGDESM
jgi:hypothetical protein